MNTLTGIFRLLPGGGLSGDIRVPGDKSISHRSIMFGSIAEGETRVSGLLEGEDVLATIGVFRQMGVTIQKQDGVWHIQGVGMHGLSAPGEVLDMGNSGTAMRLMAGLLAGQAFDSVLVGDASLSKRPMRRIADPLNLLGARVQTGENGWPPIKVFGGHPLRGMTHELKVASAQVKSAILLAGLYAEGMTTVIEPAVTRDHTERMLRGFGWPVRTEGNRISLHGGGRLCAADIEVPADISSSAFFMAGAAMTPGADIVLRHVGINPTRTGIIEILRLMGAKIELLGEREVGGEPVADIHVLGGKLCGIHVPEELVPLAIDEFPMLFVAAACAEGTTVVSGAEELRVKESDRIAVMEEGLRNIGADVRATPDGMIVQGGPIRGGEVHSHGDHRIAMALAMASLHSSEEIVIHDCENVATSFPNFTSIARDSGLLFK